MILTDGELCVYFASELSCRGIFLYGLLYSFSPKKACPNIYLKSEVELLVVLSRLTLGDPMDCSLLGSSVHGILQARMLKWVSTPFSSGSSQPSDGNLSILHCRQILYWATWEAHILE